jgi:hypothetical protein
VLSRQRLSTAGRVPTLTGANGDASELPRAVTGFAAFRRDGFTTLPGFLEQHELGPLRAVIEASLAGSLPAGCKRPHNTLVPLRWNDPIVERVLASRRRIHALTRALAADDLRWISGYVSAKEPHSAALWWHQDWWCWDHPVTYRRAAAQVAVLCYLTATGTANGALRVLPGSHHRSVPLHAALPEAHAHEAGDLDSHHAAMTDAADQVTLAARAGDAIVADYRLLHGTHPNQTARRRDCLILTFAPSWQRLPRAIRGHLIRHPAQPTESEEPPKTGWQSRLLPRFDGRPRDLALNRIAPSVFAMRG